MSPIQRIQRIMRFNYNRGICKESVNTVYRKIINMKKITIIVLSLLLFSCGARKVEKAKEETKTDTKETVKVNTDIETVKKEETKVNVIVTDSTKEEIEETIIEEIGKPKITQRKIKRSKAIKSTDNTNILANEKSSDKTTAVTEKQEQNKKSSEVKTVDKKQFDFIGQIIQYWWLWLSIILVIYLFKKYRLNILNLIKKYYI